MSQQNQQSSAESYVIQCDIEESLNTIFTFRRQSQWVYVSANPDDIKCSTLRTEFERLASSALKQQQIELKAIQGEDVDDGSVARTQRKTSKADSGYGSDDQVESDDGSECEKAFHEWLQRPIEEMFAGASENKHRTKHPTLTEWYHAPIQLFHLESSANSKSLIAVRRDDLDGEAFIRDHITPNMYAPKYIRELPNTNWYSPNDVRVLDQSHDIHLHIHPTLVEVPTGSPGESKTCFLKLASKGDESGVKRELRFLSDLDKRDIYSKGIRAPRLEGLVTLPSTPESHEHILGFLLSLIPQPSTPLTNLMSADVEETKRKRWANEVEDMVDVLHKHNFIWGDAKADNFVVDKNNKLWIIDFGGSFTVGWMDPKHAGTKKGDAMATEKIATGMRDPEDATAAENGEDHDGETSKRSSLDEKAEVGVKRRRSMSAENFDEHKQPPSGKKQKA